MCPLLLIKLGIVKKTRECIYLRSLFAIQDFIILMNEFRAIKMNKYHYNFYLYSNFNKDLC